jgi:hypothetical protein
MDRWISPRPVIEDSVPGANNVINSINNYINPGDHWNALMPFYTIKADGYYSYDTRHRCFFCNRMIEQNELKFRVYQHVEWRGCRKGLYIHGVVCLAGWVREKAIPELQTYIGKLNGLVDDIQMQFGGEQ